MKKSWVKKIAWIGWCVCVILAAGKAQGLVLRPQAPSGELYSAVFSLTQFDSDGVQVVVSVPRDPDLSESDLPGNGESYTPLCLWFRVHNGTTSSWTKVDLLPAENSQWEKAGYGAPGFERESIKDYWVYPSSWQRIFKGSAPVELPEDGTWEYFFGSGEGHGLFRISPVMDNFRYQGFNDRVVFNSSSGTAGETGSQMGAGTNHVGKVTNWIVQGGALGQRIQSTPSLEDGEFLCAVLQNNYPVVPVGSMGARIYSPVYTYGAKSVNFIAWKGTGNFEPRLRLAYVQGDAALTDDPESIPDEKWIELPFVLFDDAEDEVTETVEIDVSRSRYSTYRNLGLSGPVRFRWSRIKSINSNSATLYLAGVDDIFVESLAPVSRQEFPNNLPTVPLYPSTRKPFTQQVEIVNAAVGGGSDLEMIAPVSSVSLVVNYRIKNAALTPNEWKQIPLKAASASDFVFNVTFQTRAAVLGSYTDFYFEENGTVVSLLPGIYEYYFSGTVGGSFRINRERLDEKDLLSIAYYETDSVTGEQRPYTLDLRPVETSYKEVDVVISQADGEMPRIKMKPQGDYTWRGILPLFGSENVASVVTNYPGTIREEVTRGVSFWFEGLEKYENGHISSTPVQFTKRVDREFVIPPQGAVCDGGEIGNGGFPVRVDLEKNGTYLLVELNTWTKEYLITFAAYQDFNDWVALSDKFSDAEDVLDKVAHTATFTHIPQAEGQVPQWVPDEQRKAEEIFELTLGDFEQSFTSPQWGMGFLGTDSNNTQATDGWYVEGGLILQARNAGRLVVGNAADLKFEGFLRLFDSVIRRGTALDPLNGLGSVAVDLAAAFPYDINTALYSFEKMDVSAGIITDIDPRVVSEAGFSASLLVGYLPFGGGDFYEFRVTQRTKKPQNSNNLAEFVTGEVFKWSNGIATLQSSAESQTSLLGKTGADKYKMILYPRGSTLEARLQTNWEAGSAASILNCDVTGISSSVRGLVGVHASNAEMQFSGVRIFSGAEGDLSILPTAQNGYWNPSVAKVWTVSNGTITLNAPEVKVFLDVQEVDSLINDAPKPENWRTVNTWTVNSFRKTPFSDDKIRIGGDAYVRLRVDHGVRTGVDVDNIVMTSWRGDDGSKTFDAAPAQTEGFYSIGTWVEARSGAGDRNEQVMRFEYSRRSNYSTLAPEAQQVLVSPFLTNGLGSVSYSYRVLNKPATLVVEYAFSEYPVDDPAKNPTLYWQRSTNLTIPYNELTSDFRRQTGLAVNIRATPENQNSGYIRIAQISSNNEEACILLDDVVITDAPELTANSWTAVNARLGNEPQQNLYYGDLLDGGTFSPMMTLNTSLTGEDVESEYPQNTPSALVAPVLSNGVGRIVFEARQDSPNPGGTKVRVQLTKNQDPQNPNALWEDYTVDGVPQTFLITNTVYSTYEMDISDRTSRCVRLMTVVTNDAAVDPSYWPYAGRVNFDQVVVTDPLTPGFRIADVTFSTEPSNADPAGGFGEQPLEGNPLYVTATLDRVFLGPRNIEVYFSYVAREDYQTNDVGQLTWPLDDQAGQWGIEKWLTYRPDEEFRRPDGLIVYTTKLTHKTDYTWYSPQGINGLFPRYRPSTIVQYTVWATYTDSDGEPMSPVYFGADTYKHPTWYYPRNLNDSAELGGHGFAPYFWVYSCPPSEVFFNELNIADRPGSNDFAQFLELCAPANISLQGWRLDQVRNSAYDTDHTVTFIHEGLIETVVHNSVDLNRGFFVAGNAVALSDKIDFQVRPPWTSSSVGGFRLFRDNGAFEAGISYASTAGSIDAAKRYAENDNYRRDVELGIAYTNMVYSGVDDWNAYYSSTGIGKDGEWISWVNTAEEVETPGFELGPTPGEINRDQIIPPYEGGRSYIVTSTTIGPGMNNGTTNSVVTVRVRANDTEPNNVVLTYSAGSLHEITSIRYRIKPTGSDWEDNWQSITVGLPTANYTFDQPVPENMQVEVTYTLTGDAGRIFISARPYEYQPWVGRSMGFEIVLDGDVLQSENIFPALVTCFVGYEAPATVAEWGDQDWFRMTNDLQVANEWSADATVNVCLIDNLGSGVFRNSSAIAARTFTPEAPVQYWAWIIVTDYQSQKTFALKQPLDIFTPPDWYYPLQDINAGFTTAEQSPYFYVFGTPPGSVYLNEVNLDSNGYPRFVEIVYPHLNAFIGSSYSLAGWELRMFNASGMTNSIVLTGVAAPAGLNGAGPYFHVVSSGDASQFTTDSISVEQSAQLAGINFGTDPWAFELIRPVTGISEGGVVVSAGSAISGSSLINTGLAHPMWEGVPDPSGEIGSVGQYAETLSLTNTWQFSSGMRVPVANYPQLTASGASPGFVNANQTLIEDDFDKVTISSTIANAIPSVFIGGTQNGSDVTPLVITGRAPVMNEVTFTYEPDQEENYYVQSVRISYNNRLYQEIFEQPESGGSGDSYVLNLIAYLREKGAIAQDGGLLQNCDISVTFSNGPFNPADWIRRLELFTADQPENAQPLAKEEVGVRIYVPSTLATDETRFFVTWQAVANANTVWYMDPAISRNWGLEQWLPSLSPALPNTIELQKVGETDRGQTIFETVSFIPEQSVGTAVKYGVWYQIGATAVRQSVEFYQSPTWYVPVEVADLNARPGPTGGGNNPLHGATPYYWVYATAPRSVWINEINYHMSGERSVAELAMINDNINAVHALTGWRLENIAYSVTSGGEVGEETNSMSVDLNVAWGNVPNPADEDRLAYYVLSRGMSSIATTQELPAPFVGSLADVCVLRLYRDTGALEDEVYVLRLSANDTLKIRAAQKAVNDSLLNFRALASGFAGLTGDNVGSLQRKSLSDPTTGGWAFYSGFTTWGYANITPQGVIIQPYLSSTTGFLGQGILSASVAAGGGTLDATGVELNELTLLGTPFALTIAPEPWYRLGNVLLNGSSYQGPVSQVYRTATSPLAPAATEQVIDGVLDSQRLDFQVYFALKPEAGLLLQKGAITVTDAEQMRWLQSFNLLDVANAFAIDGITPEEKYWLNTPAHKVTEVELLFEAMLIPSEANDNAIALLGLRVNGETVPQLQGDARLVLLGKRTLMDADWIKLKDLDTMEASGRKAITLPTHMSLQTFRFFRCVLMAGAASDAL